VKGDEGEGIWLMGFTYIKKKNNETSCNCFNWGGKCVKRVELVGAL
jgi:hypothetical protein